MYTSEFIDSLSPRKKELLQKALEVRKKKKNAQKQKKRAETMHDVWKEQRAETRKRKTIEKNERKKELQKERNIKKKEREKEKIEKIKAENGGKLPKKKKMGRPKKRGYRPNYYKRRKKRLEKLNRVRKPHHMKPYSYVVCSCRNGKEVKSLGKYRESSEAYDAIKVLMEKSEQVVFPIEIDNNLEKNGNRNNKDALLEYLILEKNRNNLPNSFFPNEFGKLIENKTTNDNWIILDKFQYKEEETFWVWGYNPKTERKTFPWIYDNLLLNNLGIYDIKRVILYKNKILFKDDENNYEMIFCKTHSDAVRFYNLLETFIKRDKIKQVVFLGSYNKISDKRKQLEEDLMKKTGWTKIKLKTSGGR